MPAGWAGSRPGGGVGHAYLELADWAGQGTTARSVREGVSPEPHSI